MGFQQKKHRNITSAPVHITYRLAESLPKSLVTDLKNKRDQQVFTIRQTINLAKTPEELNHLRFLLFSVNGKYELSIEDALHKVRSGPMFLNRSELKKSVIDSWRYLHEEGRINLIAVCVMSNHVHVVLKAAEGVDIVRTDTLMRRHKSFTSKVANKILGRTGRPFWDGSYHDRTVRVGKFMQVMWYVLNNPVKAGLVDYWEDWDGTYVNPEYVGLFRVLNR